MTGGAEATRPGSTIRHGRIGVRIVAILTAIATVSALVECLVDWQRAEVAAIADLYAQGRSVARGVARKVPDLVVTNDYIALEDHVEDIVRTEEGVTAAAIVRPDGVTMSFPRGTMPADWPGDVLVEQVIHAGQDGAPIARVQLALSRLPMEARLRERAIALLVGSALSAMVIGVAMWFALRRIVVQPLRELDVEAQRLGRGELDRPVLDHGSTEIGRLGRTLDEMRQNLARSHADIAEQNRRLQELDRLKSQFLANMSHEMRTPLTSILGEVELLAETGNGGGEVVESTRAIQRNGVRLLELVDRVLDLAKVESGKLLLEQRPCRPDLIIVDACGRHGAEARECGIELRIDVAALAATTVLTDATHLAQMVNNIIDNGVKFTERGTVAVTAGWRGDGERRCLRIDVKDTGIGIPATFLAEGVGAFRQVDPSLTRQRGGSGLGLHVTRSIARGLGGDVQIQSELGVGTTVTIEIPVTCMPSAAASTEPAPAARVLVVDDARDNQHLLRAMLTRMGHEVELADNGRKAVELVLATRHGAPFDLVLMDLQMPVMDGIAATRAIRAAGFGVPIVSLTAHALADDRDRCFAAGAVAYETKPITRQRLSEVVATHAANAQRAS